MTPQREAKRVQRRLRAIPVEAVAPHIAAEEADRGGLWCLVSGGIVFVPADGSECTTGWDDALVYAQFHRWLLAHPERVHDTHAAAVGFVRSRTGFPAAGS